MRVDFAGLPEGLSPPEETAERIAALNSVAEREALWLRIPESWRPMIGVLAVHAMARRIYGLQDLAARRSALAAVPELWRSQVRALAKSFWDTHHLRDAAGIAA